MLLRNARAKLLELKKAVAAGPLAKAIAAAEAALAAPTSAEPAPAAGSGTECRLLASSELRVETSTNRTDARRILDGDLSTYWQADSAGEAGGRTVSLTTSTPGVKLGKLEFYAKEFGSSYEARKMDLYTKASLHSDWVRVKTDVALPASDGWITLLTDAEASDAEGYKMVVTSCNGGTNCRVAAMRVYQKLGGSSNALAALEHAIVAAAGNQHVCAALNRQAIALVAPLKKAAVEAPLRAALANAEAALSSGPSAASGADSAADRRDDQKIDFQDLTGLGTQPRKLSNEYASKGVTFAGNAAGVCKGTDEGDPGNWSANGTSGSRFYGFNTKGQHLTLTFAAAVHSLQLDLICGRHASSCVAEVKARRSGSGDWFRVHSRLCFSPSDASAKTVRTSVPITALKIERIAGESSFGLDNIRLSFRAAVTASTASLEHALEYLERAVSEATGQSVDSVLLSNARAKIQPLKLAIAELPLRAALDAAIAADAAALGGVAAGGVASSAGADEAIQAGDLVFCKSFDRDGSHRFVVAETLRDRLVVQSCKGDREVASRSDVTLLAKRPQMDSEVRWQQINPPARSRFALMPLLCSER